MKSVGFRLGNPLFFSAAVVGLALLVASGCGDEFSACKETRTCPVQGEGGDANSAGGGLDRGGGSTDGPGGSTDGLGGSTDGGSDGSTAAGEAGGPGGAPGSGGDGSPAGSNAGSPMAVEGDHYRYVLDSLTMATSAEETKSIAFDLNDDGVKDNTFGAAVAALHINGFAMNVDFATAIDDGSHIGLVDLETSSLSNASGVNLRTFIGQNPSPAPCAGSNDCGRHLHGTGTFDVYEKITGSPCVGAIADGVYRGGGGTLPISLVVESSVANVLLHDAQAELGGLQEAGFETGRLGGALSEEDVGGKVFPTLQAAVQATVERDCSGGPPPDCGCAMPSPGWNYLDLLDANDSCTVTLSELKDNVAFAQLFRPDIDLDHDGQNDAISVAFKASGVKATFDLP
jgi:hypothetical protein